MKRIVAVALVWSVLVAPSAASRVRSVRSAPAAESIDSHVDAKLALSGVAPAAIAGDEEFLRRVTIDLTGTIPTAAEVEAFVADAAPDKRARKVDALLSSDAFVDRWTMWFGDLVQNVQVANNSREYYLGRNVYYAWIHESIRAGKPYDVMVREVLAGAGDNFSSGVANYVVRQLQRNGPPQDTYDNLASHSTEKFLGIPVLCISCHDGLRHLEPVNEYLATRKRSDFWRMAAFFARTTARGSRYTDPNNPNANIIRYDVGTNSAGAYRLNTTDGNKSPRAPRAGEPDTVTPAFLLTGEEPRPGESYRAAYGRMLTADRQFARATVNYLWKEMFGTGLVEPVNGFDLARLEAQASHPRLLEYLATQFISSQYSLRELLRLMTASRAYQRASAYSSGPQPDPALFARRNARRLPAEVLLDAIVTATNVGVQFNVQGAGVVTKAMRLPDPLDARRAAPSRFMAPFGRGDRDDVARTNESAVAQALALMNDTFVTTRVRNASGSTVQRTLAATSDPAAIADRLYLATLSRKPTDEERRIAVDHLRGGNLAERAEDLQYALLNSLEFLFV